MSHTSRKTIFRHASADRRYTNVCNEALLGNDLSLDATGFLARIFSLPSHWDLCKVWAQERFGIGEQRLNRILKELADNGFLKTTQLRNQDGTHGKVVRKFTDIPGVFETEFNECAHSKNISVAPAPFKGGYARVSKKEYHQYLLS